MKFYRPERPARAAQASGAESLAFVIGLMLGVVSGLIIADVISARFDALLGG